MRAASPPRQMERENEMIVISHRLFCVQGSDGEKNKTARLKGRYMKAHPFILRGEDFRSSFPHYPRSADRMPAAPFSPDLAILPLFSLLCVMRHLLDTDLTKK